VTATAPVSIPIGVQAPDFTLASTDGHDVTLSSFRGVRPVLLAFFPLAFTSTCTTELCAFRDEYDRFAELGVQILPISVDATASLREYKRQLGTSIDMLSDFRREVSRLYGVLIEERYYSNRAYFLIDRDGLLRWSHVEHATRDRRTNDEIIEAVRALGAAVDERGD
jgi:peroxiredoxin